ncbi:MgtC/SapB family protein [Taibaiella koreensis]|uniref:MgtC/SapB family protein n=1 Tax=Taibaiella koreensis TaxID=1268548 RepID=UPI000E59B91D|nr:MgtC/SapB family protein [Taibaiella koreensis]
MHYTLSEDIKHILIALLIGAVIGAEREYRSKSAGLRTMILVSLGACLFTILSIRIGNENPDRIAANIITGIGFLGAGVIFKDENRVTGITTATTIWMVAALGMAIGSGHYQAAAVGTVAVLIVLAFLAPLQSVFERINRSRHYRIVCPYRNTSLAKYEALFKKHKLKASRGRQSRTAGLIEGNWEVQGPDRGHEKVIQELLRDPDIHEFDF